MKCSKCGNELNVGNKYCPNCGDKVTVDQSETASHDNININIQNKVKVSKNTIIGMILGVIILIAIIGVFASKSVSKNKLVGTWASEDGDVIEFFEDGTWATHSNNIYAEDESGFYEISEKGFLKIYDSYHYKEYDYYYIIVGDKMYLSDSPIGNSYDGLDCYVKKW